MTKNDWILDVLADLRAFATSNGMGALAEQLDDTMLIAASELVSHNTEAQVEPDGKHRSTRSNTGGSGRHQHA